MAQQDWSKTVLDAILRHISKSGSAIFSRQALIDAELENILLITGSIGATPHQTLSRELQELRDGGLLEFLGGGTYKWTGAIGDASVASSKGVFVVSARSMYDDEPERFYRFPSRWLSSAIRTIGNWIIYQEPRRAGGRGYYAVAQVEKIVEDPSRDGMYLALIRMGSFMEFGRDVPFRLEGAAIERGLLDPNGKLNNGRAVQSIRSISDEDFYRIMNFGLVDEAALLPRVDEEAEPLYLREERMEWEGPIDRSKVLVSRTVRDRQFRKRILEAYQSTCALTGMRLINGGGRAEAQAAHIMSVESGGPDSTNNGIALSGTVHWMFDRGLISLDDSGGILLSSKINDIEGVKRLIFRDGRARLPRSPLHRPHSRYLSWHRNECFHA